MEMRVIATRTRQILDVEVAEKSIWLSFAVRSYTNTGVMKSQEPNYAHTCAFARRSIARMWTREPYFKMRNKLL